MLGRLEGVGLLLGGTLVVEVVAVASLQRPSQPRVVQVVLDDGGMVVVVVVTVVMVGPGLAERDDEVAEVVVVGSLQPNQPGVWQVEVDVEVVVVIADVVGLVVVVSSRHPHQPGVLHVSVRVRVYVLVGLLEALVVVSVPLLS